MPVSIVYIDTWRGYNVFDVTDFKHYCINHLLYFTYKQNRTNSIEFLDPSKET